MDFMDSFMDYDDISLIYTKENNNGDERVKRVGGIRTLVIGYLSNISSNLISLTTAGGRTTIELGGQQWG